MFCCLYSSDTSVCCKIAGQAFAGRQPTKVLNRENVEIDDIRDVQDGDHLFLFENGYQTTESNVTRLII